MCIRRMFLPGREPEGPPEISWEFGQAGHSRSREKRSPRKESSASLFRTLLACRVAQRNPRPSASPRADILQSSLPFPSARDTRDTPSNRDALEGRSNGRPAARHRSIRRQLGRRRKLPGELESGGYLLVAWTGPATRAAAEIVAPMRSRGFPQAGRKSPKS